MSDLGFAATNRVKPGEEATVLKTLLAFAIVLTLAWISVLGWLGYRLIGLVI